MSWIGRVRQLQAQGVPYNEACRRLGSAGGKKAAGNRYAQDQHAADLKKEQERQVGMKLRDTDEIMTEQDRASIAMDQRKRRVL